MHRNDFEGSGGNAYDIPSSKCSVSANASFNFEHEMGHCLGFLQDRLTPADRIITGVTLPGEIAVGAQNGIQVGNIGMAGNVTMNGNAHGMFNAGQFIRLAPGTGIIPSGASGILLTINQMCEGLFLPSEFPVADRDQPDAARAGMQVSPNPFTDQVQVQITLQASGSASLSLFDVSGKLLNEVSVRMDNHSNKHTELLQLPHLQPGLYFLRLQHTGGSETF